MGSEARARIGLWTLLAASLFSFAQVFATGDYPGPAVLGILLASGITVGARRLGAGPLLAGVASLLGLTWYASFVFQAERTFWSLPTPDALAALGRNAARALEHSRIDYAPVPIRPGYALLLVAGLWAATTIGELATFRWRRPLIASLFPIVLFCVAAVVGTGASSSLLVALFLAALLTYWGLESSHRLRSWGRWVSAWGHVKDGEPVSITGALARRIGASAVICALISPLFLPALGDGLVAWRTGMGEGSGLGSGGSDRIDPWVSIEPRLVEQDDRELFQVEADNSDYWYVATLEVYDGRDWREASDDRVPAERGAIDSRFVAAGPTKSFSQTIVSTGLGGDALPAAKTPALVWQEDDDGNDSTEGIVFDPSSGMVQVNDIDEGDRFRVISEVPDIRYKDLAGAEPSVPDPVYTMRTTELDPRVKALLQRWTASAPTPLEKLTAIQDRLRLDFSYSLNPDQRSGDDYLTEFLLDVRAGYCQQFATAFALLARELGMASRVAVGFLPGSRNEEGLWSVRGTDAHAWPEVYFQNFGWVRFEPTPRSDSAAPAYTTPPLPESDGRSFTPNNVQNPWSDPGTRGELREAGGQVDPINPDGRPLDENPGEGAAGRDRRAPNNITWQRTFNRVSVVALGLILLFLVIVPLAKEFRIRRRFAGAHGPNAMAAAAFVQFQEEAAGLAEMRLDAESPSAFARRLATAGRVTERSAMRLATLYEAAAYAHTGLSEVQGNEAKRLAHQLRAQLWTKASWWERARRLFSPRGLLPEWPVLLRPVSALLPAGRTN